MNTASLKWFCAFLALPLCSLVVLGGCGASPKSAIRVVGTIPSNDVVEIEKVVHRYIYLGSRRDPRQRELAAERRASDIAHPILSIEATTNGAVDVWYSGKECRWGRGGYMLQKGSNVWEIRMQYFQ
jgi:hypothetical protein